VEAKVVLHQRREHQLLLQPLPAELTASNKPSQLHAKARWDSSFSARSTPATLPIASDIWTCSRTAAIKSWRSTIKKQAFSVTDYLLKKEIVPKKEKHDHVQVVQGHLKVRYSID
jgi:hypothetical protein